MSDDERLFIASHACALVYCDQSRNRRGDFVELAVLSYGTLALEFESDCPPDLAAEILTHGRAMQARRGEEYVVSVVGQTVRLGDSLAADGVPQTRFRPPPEGPTRLRYQFDQRRVEAALVANVPDVALAMVNDAGVKLGLIELDYLMAEAAFERARPDVIEAIIDRRVQCADYRPGPATFRASFRRSLTEALRWASVHGDIGLMDVLVKRGAEPAADDSLAMRWAADKGQIDAVRWLIDRGADPQANRGEALRTARQRGSTQMVRVLEAGAKPESWKGRVLRAVAGVDAAISQHPAPGCG
jgi:hypothetical protein